MEGKGGEERGKGKGKGRGKEKGKCKSKGNQWEYYNLLILTFGNISIMSVSHSLLLCMNMSVQKGFDPDGHLKLKEVLKSFYHRDESEHSFLIQQIDIDEHRK